MFTTFHDRPEFLSKNKKKVKKFYLIKLGIEKMIGNEKLEIRIKFSGKNTRYIHIFALKAGTRVT